MITNCMQQGCRPCTEYEVFLFQLMVEFLKEKKGKGSDLMMEMGPSQHPHRHMQHLANGSITMSCLKMPHQKHYQMP